MKALQKPKNLPFLVLGVGLTGIFLRVALYAVGAGQRGLISNLHPLHLLCLLLTAATGAHIALTVRKADISGQLVPAGKGAIVLPILATLWFLANAFTAIEQSHDRFDAIRAGLAFAAVPCFLFTGHSQYKQTKPFFGFHGVITLFFAIDMICRYRTWSGNPQTVDYIFHLFACVFLTLTAYYHTAFDTGLGSRRMWLFCSLMTVLFCTLSLVGGDRTAFYVGGILWALSGICLPVPLDEPDEAEEC